MALSLNQAFSLIKLFKSYCNFYYVENQVALIDGRNYDIIFLIMKELERITTNSADSKLDQVITLIDTYIEETIAEYGTHAYGEDSCQFSNSIFPGKIKTIFEDHDLVKYFKAYYDAYELLFLYNDMQEHKFEVLLVEFNSALSHLLLALSYEPNDNVYTQNITRAKSHIYRACLDAYKEIIVNEVYRGNNEVYSIPHDIKRDLFILRLKEIKKVGYSENNKLDMVNEYYNIAYKLMNLPD